MPLVITTIQSHHIHQSDENDFEEVYDEPYDLPFNFYTDPQEICSVLIMYMPPSLRPSINYLIQTPSLRQIFTRQEKGILPLIYHFFALQCSMTRPSMMTFEKRQETYETVPMWPLKNPHLSTTIMSLWGFFRKDNSKNHTCCFACGCILSDWEPNDNPFIAHKQFRPQCPWLGIVVIMESLIRSLQIFPEFACDMSIISSTFPTNASSFNKQHCDIPKEIIHSRLLRLVEFNEQLSMPMTKLFEMGSSAYAICRDIFLYPLEMLNYAVWRKLLRYYCTQKIEATLAREATIELKHLFSSSVMLIKEMKLFIDNKSEISTIYPYKGGLEFIQEINLLLHQPDN